MISHKINDLMKKTLELVDVKSGGEKLKERLKYGIIPGKTTGWYNFDEFYQFPPFGQLNIVTGTPGSGKSEWLDSLAINVIQKHQWKVLFYSPENNPPDFHLEKMVEKITKKSFSKKWNNTDQITEQEIEESTQLLDEHCTFADCQLNAGDLVAILNTVILQALTDKVNMVIIDPWNKVETGAPPGMNKTDYIGHCLSTMQMVARKYNIHIFVAAHPAKPQKTRDGKIPIPSLYDISDSAHWFNMADNGFVIHRSYKDKIGDENLNQVHILKIKDRRYGRCGEYSFRFLPWCSGFEETGNVVPGVSQSDAQVF